MSSRLQRPSPATDFETQHDLVKEIIYEIRRLLQARELYKFL